jgi:hypothetical protein
MPEIRRRMRPVLFFVAGCNDLCAWMRSVLLFFPFLDLDFVFA